MDKKPRNHQNNIQLSLRYTKSPEKTKEERSEKMTELAVIRLKSTIKAEQDVKDTMKMLNLNTQNHCVIIPEKPEYTGMLQKVKDYITWGEVDEETKEKMEKRKDGKVYKLKPPRKGFKSLKKTFNNNGADRIQRKKINELLERMI